MLVITFISEIIYVSLFSICLLKLSNSSLGSLLEFYVLPRFVPLPRFLTNCSFIQFETSDMTSKANCDALDGTNLKAAFCSLPKACEGIAVVAWYLTPSFKTYNRVLSLVVLGVRWWASHDLPAGHSARIALYPDSNPSLERKAIASPTSREKAETSPA